MKEMVLDLNCRIANSCGKGLKSKKSQLPYYNPSDAICK